MCRTRTFGSPEPHDFSRWEWSEDFLNYINNGTVGNSKFIQELDREVQKNSSNTLWKEEYNMLLAREEMLLEEGVQKGIEKQKQEMYNSFVAVKQWHLTIPNP